MLNLLDLFARESLNWLMQSKLYSNRDIAWLHHSDILIVKGYSQCTLRLEHTVYALLGCGLVPVDFTHILKGYFTGTGAVMGVVSLTFCELSKIISWKYTMSEITFMARISSWNMALGTLTKFQLEILIRSTISAIHKFWMNILWSSQNVSEKQPKIIAPVSQKQNQVLIDWYTVSKSPPVSILWYT